jgi:sugar lactone lactonase YvrE
MRLLRLVVLGALAAALLAPPAEAAVYWTTGSGHVGVANDDGSQAFWPLPGGYLPALEVGEGRGLAVDAAHLYWANGTTGAIGRSNLDGTGPDEALVTGLVRPCGLAVAGGRIYWADRETNMIGRANLDGSDVEPAFVVGARGPCGVAGDSSHVFWANTGGESIGRANLDGSGVEEDFISGLEWPFGVAVDGAHLYWGERVRGVSAAGSIARTTLAGTAVEEQFVPAVGEPDAVAVDASGVYWADESYRELLGGAIGRADLDGSHANRALVDGLDAPKGVALDSRVLPGPTPRPSEYLHFGKLTPEKGGRRLTLRVHVPARGEFAVTSPAIGWSIGKGNPPPWVGGTFTWKLRLWPGNGAVGKRIRRQLKRRGIAPFTLRVTYQQEGRLPLEASKRLAFVRRRIR